MAEMDHHCCVSDNCSNVSHQNIDLFVHSAPSRPYSPPLAAPDLWATVFSRHHHPSVPDRSIATVPAAQGRI